jgi:hypothetical protein
VFYSNNSDSINILPLNDRLTTYDRIICISLWGGLIACGTELGYVYIYECPSTKRFPVVNHYRPLFSRLLTSDRIVQITISCDDICPIVAASTQNKVFVFKWKPQYYVDDHRMNSVENDFNAISICGDSDSGCDVNVNCD